MAPNPGGRGGWGGGGAGGEAGGAGGNNGGKNGRGEGLPGRGRGMKILRSFSAFTRGKTLCVWIYTCQLFSKPSQVMKI